MFYKEELRYLKQNKENIILMWFESWDKQFSGKYSFTDMKVTANEYFLYIIEFDIPAETHPHFNLVCKKTEPSLPLALTINHLLSSTQYWNDAFFNVLLKYENPKAALECFNILMFRQNVFLKKISDVFMQKSKIMIEEKDLKIDKLHDDRISLIGKMASSMAHEIRNPLTSIAGFLKLIRQNIINRNEKQLQKYMDVIDDEFDTINMHITGFLSFSRNKAFEEKNIEISFLQLINSTLYLLNPRLINENIQLFISDEENCIINVQKISIQQVISNIISNAIDALITVDYPRKLKILCYKDEESTYIQIINNGPTISQEMKDSLFVPFITSKEEGTGLGLAISKEIMTKNNGNIEFTSNDEETSFILSFRK